MITETRYKKHCNPLKNVGIIYKISSPSGKIYIGQTSDFKERMRGHKCSYRNGIRTPLSCSINHYGFANHYIELLWVKEGAGKKELNKMEIFYIKKHNSFFCDNKESGMNLTIGGNCMENSTVAQKLSKIVYQYSIKTGELLNEFSSLNHAALSLGNNIEVKKNISFACVNNRKSNGFYWSHEKKLKYEPPDKIYRRRMQTVIQFDKNLNEINRFSCIAEASDKTGIYHKTIFGLCKNSCLHNGKYVFKNFNCTNPQSVSDADIFKFLTERASRPKSNKKCKVLQYDADGNLIKKYDSMSQVAKAIGKNQQTVSNYVNGIIKHRDFIFKRALTPENDLP